MTSTFMASSGERVLTGSVPRITMETAKQTQPFFAILGQWSDPADVGQ